MAPMEEWNKHALISMQGKLKDNVIMNLGLINMLQLAAGGFMMQSEAQAVESKPSNAEQMGELIRILLGKRNADFYTFCKMLRDSNYALWADELERKAGEFRELGMCTVVKGRTWEDVWLLLFRLYSTTQWICTVFFCCLNVHTRFYRKKATSTCCISRGCSGMQQPSAGSV